MKKRTLLQKRENTLKYFLLLIVFALSTPSLLVAQGYTIPTVVHIIASNDFPLMLTDANVYAGISNINSQFSGEYATSIINTIIPEHQNLITNTNVQLQLATIDPNGNPTNGITRTHNDTWSKAAYVGSNEIAIKSDLAWDRSKYFNIYVVHRLNNWNQAGVCYRPSEVSSSADAIKDGALVTFSIWPSSLPLSYPQWVDGFEGTLVHEVGHFLNLIHTWGNDNNPIACSNPNCNDFVADTPKHSATLDGFLALQQVIGCDGEIAMTDNFMTYSRHQCVFTPGQASRMHNALNSSTSSRNNLWTPANLVATGVNGGTPPPNIYCLATGANGTDTDYISNVTVGTINNNSGKTPYSDFSSQSTDIAQGNSYPISIAIEYDWGQDQAYAWVDWNDDKVFDNTTELITFTTYNNEIATGTITVPTNAVLGSIRLRTRNIYASPNTPESCNDIYGEVEDYTLNIITSTPTPTTYCLATGANGTDTDYISNVTVGTINNNSGKTPYSDFSSQSTDIAQGNSYPISITIEYDWGQDQAYAWVDWNDDKVFDNTTELITFTPYNNEIATGTITVPTNAALGSIRLRTRNIYASPNTPESCNDIYGEVEDYTLNIIASTPTPTTYCLATGANGTSTDYISNVTIGTINNNSGKTPYSDFSSQSTDIAQGNSYPISITIEYDWGQDQAYAWVDWNDDKVFDNTTELITFTPYNNEVATGVITVPTNAALGSIRLRTRNIYASPNTPESCNDIYGEVEDYTLNIIASTPTPTTYCLATGANGTDTDYISNVTVGTINNNSGKTPYSDFSSQSTDIAQGNSYPISIAIEYDWGQDQAYAWVDWNDDKVFDNTTELITFTPYNNEVATGVITVPTNAALGSIRLRTRNIYASPNNPEPCNDIYGEVEDYTLNVTNSTCETITSDGFETGFGNWNDGGSDAARKQINPNTGIWSVRLRDNSGISSSIYSDALDLSPYSEIFFSFSFFPFSMENGEDFFLEKSLDGGATYSTVQTWVRGTDFSNNIRYNESILINGTFTSNTVFRLRCDASGNYDHIFIDDVVIATCLAQSMSRPFDTTIVPSHVTKDKGVNQISVLTEIKAYPNPTSGSVTIKLDATYDLIKIKLKNIFGQELYTNSYRQVDHFPIEIIGPTGIYFLELETSAGKKTGIRILKQ